MQNPDKLRISKQAEDLALAVYQYTDELPQAERWGAHRATSQPRGAQRRAPHRRAQRGFLPPYLHHTLNAPVTPPLPSLEILANTPTANQHASMNDPP